LKKLIFIFFFFILGHNLFAQNNLGIGARISSIAGINLKYWTSNIDAFDFSVSWTVDSFWYSETNYLYHWQMLLDNSTFFPYLSTGIFGGKSIGDGTEIYRTTDGWFQGLNLKTGISFPISRIDLSVETGLRLLTYPKTEPDFENCFIVRYWF